MLGTEPWLYRLQLRRPTTVTLAAVSGVETVPTGSSILDQDRKKRMISHVLRDF